MIQTELSNKRFTLKQGDQLTVTEDCYCEHDLYEITKYYRKGLELKTLKEGDKVEVIKEWSNLYDNYVRCKFEDKIYDINPKNLKK